MQTGVNLGATLQGSVSGNQFSLIEAGTDKNANGINVARCCAWQQRD